MTQPHSPMQTTLRKGGGASPPRWVFFISCAIRNPCLSTTQGSNCGGNCVYMLTCDVYPVFPLEDRYCPCHICRSPSPNCKAKCPVENWRNLSQRASGITAGPSEFICLADVRYRGTTMPPNHSSVRNGVPLWGKAENGHCQ